MVDFPDPEEPTMNVVSLAGRNSETLDNTGTVGLEGYAKVTLYKAISPAHLEGTLRSLELDEVASSLIRLTRAAMAILPLARTMNWGTHIWRLLDAIRHAQKTAITSPGVILPSRTSLEPNQKPCTNMAIITNWEAPEVDAQSLFILAPSLSKRWNTALARPCSYAEALKALTVAIAVAARSIIVAATPMFSRSVARMGPANP